MASTHGGWCPKGGWAEDFAAPPGITGQISAPERDAARRSGAAYGMEYTRRRRLFDCGRRRRAGNFCGDDTRQRAGAALPQAAVGRDLREPVILERAAPWLRAQRAAFGAGFTLAIGGPRESEAPGIYERAVRFVAALLA